MMPLCYTWESQLLDPDPYTYDRIGSLDEYADDRRRAEQARLDDDPVPHVGRFLSHGNRHNIHATVTARPEDTVNQKTTFDVTADGQTVQFTVSTHRRNQRQKGRA